MIKKIRDFTIGEVDEICRNYYCPVCPFFKDAGCFSVCYVNPKFFSNGLFFGASILDEEVEVPEELVGNSEQVEEENE